jgi:hypothetical protein
MDLCSELCGMTSQEKRGWETLSKQTHVFQETNIIGLCILSKSVEEKIIRLYGVFFFF